MKRPFVRDFEQIFTQDLPELEKLRQGFDWVINFYLAESQGEQDTLKALGDRESLVKEQVKASTLRHARQIFRDCYLRATGRRAWNDEN